MMNFLILLTLYGFSSTAPARDVELSLTPREPLQGQVFLVELSGTKAQDQVSGRFGQQKIRFFLDEARRHRALVAVRLKQPAEPVSLLIEITLPDGDLMVHGVPVSVRKRKIPYRTLRVAPKYVRPPRRVRQRIRRESKAMSALWRAEATPRAWRGSFVPALQGAITSPYGATRRYNRKYVRSHYGVDINGNVGDPLKAIATGRVVMVADRYYSGGTVVIDHGLKLFSLYYHLSTFLVEAGQWVEKGQHIGSVGKSGRVTGPHLHLATKIENVTFDPMSLFDLDLDEHSQAPEAQEVKKIETKLESKD